MLYRESFPALLTTYERYEIGLTRSPSVAEVVYPPLALATLIVALGASEFQGGEEMLGYVLPIAEVAKNFGVDPAKYLPGRVRVVLGSDGLHMASGNCVYLSSDSASIRSQVELVESMAVLDSWCDAIGEPRIEGGIEEARRRVADVLEASLRPFRESKFTNQDLVERFESGSNAVRSQLRSFLVEQKRRYKVPGFVRG